MVVADLGLIESFPPDFVFGVATSSYQIEGGSYGGCGQSHWDTFARGKNNTFQGQDGSIACAHFLHWQQDLDLVGNAGLDAYRFSFSWPRLLPSTDNEVNPAGLAFYDRLIDGMLSRNLQPFATLHHWDLPLRLADAGGWRNRDTAKRFADYADLIMRNFGNRLTTIAPINEPWCVAWLSHYWGIHAPGMRSLEAAALAMHYVQLAHGLAVEVMRGYGHKKLGAVLNKEYPVPADDSALAKAKVELFDGIYNRWFEESIFKGCYPANVLEILAPHMPENYADDLPLISAPLDWVGINYYTRAVIQPDSSEQNIGFRCARGDLPKTAMDWEIYPAGLACFLRRAAKEYAPGLPIYVTENGMASTDRLVDGKIQDPARIDFLALHLEQVALALAEELPVRGYFAWTLLDNYEWTFGSDKRFGLVHVDFASQVRTPKQSWYALSAILQKRASKKN